MLRMTLADIKGVPYDVVLAKDLKSGLAELALENFGLLLLDLTIKGNKGLAALHLLEQQNLAVPVVILTAREDQPLAMEAVKCGAQDYLIKGRLDANVLARVIHYAMERHRVMSEMIEKNRELERLSALKSEFVSTVSHELRTPLTVILSTANNLLEGVMGALTADQEKWIKKINNHGMRLHDMINDILDLSKLQSGKNETRRGWVEIEPLVRSIMESVGSLAQGKNIALTLELSAGLTPLWGDARHLERVLTNLLSNGIKFTPAQGKVSLSIREVEQNLEFAVADTGPGIAPEHQQMIFERFRQIRQTNDADKATQGIGLGLAICKEIVVQHKGKIWVESQPGQGSRFLFSLPIQPADSMDKAA